MSHLLENIFGFCIFLFGLWLFFLLISWLSKISGKSLSHRGSEIVNPDDFENILNIPTKMLKKIRQPLSNKASEGKKENSDKNSTTELAKFLKEISELRDRKLISDKEYEILKKKILNR